MKNLSTNMMRKTTTAPMKTVSSVKAISTVMKPMPKAAPVTPPASAKRPLVNALHCSGPIVDLSNPGSSYVAVGITIFGTTGTSLLSADGKIVLFDSVAIAQQFVPMLGMGRSPVWSAGGEEVTFLPLEPNTISQAVILTGYDPYHLPAGMPAGIRSETAGKEWRGHIMWSHAFFDCGQFK